MKILSFFFWQDIIALGVCSLGDRSSSSAQTSTATTNVDKRQVIDNGAMGITADNSTINMTDQGAVKAASQLADTALITNAGNFKTLLETAQVLSKGALDALKANTTMAQSLTTSTQSAYADAASQATGNKNLVYASLAVVAMVGFSYFSKKA